MNNKDSCCFTPKESLPFTPSAFLLACSRRQAMCEHGMADSVQRCISCVIDEAEARLNTPSEKTLAPDNDDLARAGIAAPQVPDSGSIGIAREANTTPADAATPRTDAVIAGFYAPADYVAMRDHARQLERELAEARSRIAQCYSEITRLTVRAEDAEARGTPSATGLDEAERRVVAAIQYIGTKAGVAEATYGAMCHEVRSILRSIEADRDIDASDREVKTDPAGWIAWHGGAPEAWPVDGKTMVQVRFRSGFQRSEIASLWNWSHTGAEDDIVAYRLTSTNTSTKEKSCK